MAALITLQAASTSTTVAVPSVHERIAFWLKHARPNTGAAYAGDLHRFATWLGEASLGAGLAQLLSMPRALALHTLERYQTHLKGQGRAPATINRAISAINAALKEAAKAEVGPGDLPVKSLKVRAYRDTKGPGLAKTSRLLEAIDAGRGPVDRRDRAIVLLMAQRGLRRAEVAGLVVADVDLAAARIRVRRKGSDEAEWLAISQSTVNALGAWLSVRPTMAAPDIEALFVVATNRKRGAAMSGDSIYRMLEARGRKIGVRVRPHGLRHGAITELIQRSNGNVAMAQAFAGHANPSTTTRYIDNLNDLAGQGVRLLGNVF
ncbi:MAG: tyrosine-type recombinase/integrase [Hyphomicrobium sp.]|uniref:site-specific integrase n=1 Tax=Hyphomicrobium sp. TaxID=82 RepID=UPI0013227FC8|nr:site-specific integrase [Hyphomicrobium sp.]KAB2942938.1 MAG: site-specific integrase [Hyphomicrobium sp.]MBZ0210891.1 tyrosine-type recombinase/integrase [Hyphomicrobium sp.]